MLYASARELFESARAAAIDVAKCHRQLDSLEAAAMRIGGPSLEPHIQGGDHEGFAGRVDRLVDVEGELHKRIEQSESVIDLACTLLYGKEQDGSDGLATLCPGWWCDAAYHHYIGLKTWPYVAALMCYSRAHVTRCVSAAFDIADAYGLISAVNGTGSATDE